MEIVLLILIGFSAGFIDSIVGGGGMIQLPGLMITYPTLSFPVLLGTNKLASMAGTSVAVVRFQRAAPFSLTLFIPAIIAALGGSYIGATIATQISSENMKPVVLFLLIAVFIFFLSRPDFGNSIEKEMPPFDRALRATVISLVIGLYDGFFGPGTGTWLIICAVLFLGFGFMRASAFAKFINLATNVAALISFARAGVVDWQIGSILAVSSMSGSFIGSSLAISKGNTFVRRLFLFVVSALIIKLGMDFF